MQGTDTATLEVPRTLEDGTVIPKWGSRDHKIMYRTGQVNHRGTPICGAKTRSGKPCHSTALGPAKRCRVHNGWAQKGVMASNFQHGRYSKLLPPRLEARYKESMEDPDLLAMGAEISLIDARIGDLMGRVNSGESSKVWNDLSSARKGYLDAQAEGDTENAAKALSKLLRIVGQGHADFAIWHDVVNLLEKRKNFAESERKRLKEMNQMVTAEQATVLVSAIIHSLKGVVFEHCDDTTATLVLTAVAADVARLLDRPDRSGSISTQDIGLG